MLREVHQFTELYVDCFYGISVVMKLFSHFTFVFITIVSCVGRCVCVSVCLYLDSSVSLFVYSVVI